MPDARVFAAYLRIDERLRTPVLEKISPDSMTVETAWNQITFLDGTVSEIIHHVKRGRWHYHDRYTGVWDSETNELIPMKWPMGDQYFDIPLFLSKGDKLRYPFMNFRDSDILRVKSLKMGCRKIRDGIQWQAQVRKASGLNCFPEKY